MSERLSQRVNLLITIITLAMAAYHLFSSQVLLYSPRLHQNTHLAFALVLVFLLTIKKKPKQWPVMLVLILASLTVAIYIAVFFVELEIRAGYPTIPDICISILLIFLVFEASREAFGYIIPAISLVFLGYLFLGQYLPGYLSHIALDPGMLISWLGVGFAGIFGTTAMAVSAKFLFMFILFGGVLRVSGVIPLFLEIGKIAGRRMVGGAAQTAVISSALVGTVTGSSVANVPITGSFTIPLMKSVGYKPHEAGAIECAASAGGQILPPIMGVSAFMMAAITLIPYWQICVAAFIPALFYFFSIGVGVELRARRAGIRPSREPVNKGIILRRFPIFLVPLTLIFYLLSQGHSPMYVACWATIGVFVTPYVLSLVTKERPSLKQWMDGFSQGALDGAKIAVTVGAIGIIISAVITTGLGFKLSSMVSLGSHGILFLALLITMFVSLLIGCGVPTMAAYILVAILVAPALVKMGVPLLAAHLFCFYFAVFSTVTPPVATAALPASSISGGNYFKTAVEAFKISIVAFVIPFVFVYNTAFLTEFSNPLSDVLSIAAFGLSILPLGAVLAGQYLTRLSWLGRGFAAITAAVLIGCAVNAFGQGYLLFAIGVALFIMFTLWQRAQRRATVAC